MIRAEKGSDPHSVCGTTGPIGNPDKGKPSGGWLRCAMHPLVGQRAFSMKNLRAESPCLKGPLENWMSKPAIQGKLAICACFWDQLGNLPIEGITDLFNKGSVKKEAYLLFLSSFLFLFVCLFFGGGRMIFANLVMSTTDESTSWMVRHLAEKQTSCEII